MRLFHRKFAAQGASPGVVVPSPDSHTPRVSVMTYDADHLEETACDSFADVAVLTRGERVTWIDVQGLGDGSVVQELGRSLGLHPLAISDVVNVGQRPKVDHYGDGLFIVVSKVMLGEDDRLRWEQVSLFLCGRAIVTFQETHDDCLEPLRERIRSGRGLVRSSGADYLACMVIDGIVDGYFPVLEHYGQCLEGYEDQILGEGRRDLLSDLYMTKRDLAGFRRATWPLRDALSHMIRDDEVVLTETTLLYMRDVLDHSTQVAEVNESYRELSASLVDVHLSMLGQRTNDIVRVLTVVSAIFIPLTFVAGVFGMNFDRSSPLNQPELGWRAGYLLFWVICLFLAGGLLLVFRRLGWLRR